MKRNPFRILCPMLLIAAPAFAPLVAQDAAGWISLFDGRTLAGWTPSEAPGSFTVRDGVIVARATGDFIRKQAPHPKCHLFYVGPTGKARFTNFEFEAEVMAQTGANGGIYFHTEPVTNNWPQTGFEIQINNTYKKDPRKTGSLYAVQDVGVAPIGDHEWFTLWLKVEGPRVQIKINGVKLVDWTQPEGFVQVHPPWFSARKLSSGTIALQAHDPESTVYYRNLKVKPLP